jgi:glycosyltransferase involved in cell wall biosynthesis
MGEDVVLLVIGSLTVEKEYTNICKKAALNCKEIHFLGEKSNVGDYLYCSDALCISSLYEGLPLVCLEAMSLGKPILSTPAGGVPDVVIDSINGYISKDFTPNSYGEILHKFLLSPVRNSAHIIEEFNEKYSMTICKNNYYNLYLKVLKTFK